MPNPELVEYDDRQAAVCQTLGMEPSGWQVGGRHSSGRFFWGIYETETKAREGVDRWGGLYSHLIYAQYPDLSDAWALEAMSAVLLTKGLSVSLTRVVGSWSAQVWSPNGLRGGAAGRTAGEAVRDALYFCLGLHRAS